jgi:hypothetical protein
MSYGIVPDKLHTDYLQKWVVSYGIVPDKLHTDYLQKWVGICHGIAKS